MSDCREYQMIDDLEVALASISSSDNQKVQKDITIERNDLYTQILETVSENFKKRLANNAKYKNIVFWCTVCLLGVVTWGLLVSMIVAIFVRAENLLGIIITAGTAMIGSIVSILTIITRYLFPSEEEQNMNKLIQTFISHDEIK